MVAAVCGGVESRVAFVVGVGRTRPLFQQHPHALGGPARGHRRGPSLATREGVDVNYFEIGLCRKFPKNIFWVRGKNGGEGGLIRSLFGTLLKIW